MDFLESVKKRRSIYGISNKSSISDDKLIKIIKEATQYVPSAFNNQSQMSVLLLGENHNKFWNIVMDSLQKVVPAANFSATEAKINSFKSGYGTVLYYNDDNITKDLQAKYPLYANNFPVWAEQSSGMLQYVIWNMLENDGLGASLQHYNPIIDDSVRQAFDIHSSWRLIAQMPFGIPTASAGPKDFIDINTRVRIIK